MESELDYIVTSYASLKLGGRSPLKDVCFNSPSKLVRSSSQKQSSRPIKRDPQEISDLCLNSINLIFARFPTIRSLDSSYLKLASSCFFQLYKANIKEQRSEVAKKHQLYIVKLIELETAHQTSYSYSLAEIRSAYLKQPFRDSSNPLDILLTDASITLKFLILQIIFKKFQRKNYLGSETLLQFLLHDSTFMGELSSNQKISLIKLILSLGKSNNSQQFKQCMNLRFLQYLIQFDMKFEDFVYGMKKEKFIKDVETRLLALEDFAEVPFFLFDYAIVDKSQGLLKVLKVYQKLFSANPLYLSIQWNLVVSDPLIADYVLNLLETSGVNNELLQDLLNSLGKPDEVLIKRIGEYLITSLSSSPTSELQPIIIFYMKHMSSPNKEIFKVLDKFVIESSKFVDSPTFIQESFTILHQYFIQHKCFKRLKNISNLFYNYASKVLDAEFSVSFILDSLKIEAEIFKYDCETSDLCVKLGKSIHFLLNNRLSTIQAYSTIFDDDTFKNFDVSNLINTGNDLTKFIQTYETSNKPSGILLLIKLHISRAKILSMLGNHLQSIWSIRLSLQLSRAFLKNYGVNLEVLNCLSSSFRNLIKSLIHLGIFKDANYYIEELIKLNNSISKNEALFVQNCYFISYFYSITGRDEQCIEFKEKADEIFNALDLSNESTVDIKLTFFNIVSEIYLENDEKKEQIQEKLTKFFETIENDGHSYSTSWRQYYEYHFNTEMSLKNTTNPFINAMDLMITARKLFLNAQNSLNADPLFSTLEDSAMSIPSTTTNKNILCLKPAHTTKSSTKLLRKITNSINDLNQSNQIVLDLIKKLNYLSNHHIVELHKILSLDLLTLSSISNSYENEFVTECYELNDYSKHQHLVNEKELINILNDTSRTISNDTFESMQIPTQIINSVPSNILQRLPKTCLVVTIDICSFNGDLIISKYEHGQTIPSFLRLPLSRHSSRTVDEESFSFASALIELKQIIDASNSTTSKERISSIVTPDDKRQWHQERHEIDENLRLLLEKIEYCWLGGFKGIFNQEKVSPKQLADFKEKFLNIIRQNIPSRSQKNTSTVEIDDFVVELFLKLGDPSKLLSTELLEDLIYFVLDVLLFHGEKNAYDEVDIDNIYVQVENLVKDYIMENPNPLRNKHTVLVIGKECQSIPWESLPSLRNTSVTRMPSLSYLLKIFEENQKMVINKKNGGYILNPSGDLIKTEERIKGKFKEIEKDLNWKGTIATRPTEEEFEKVLDESNLFVYVGHGGGEQFIRSATLKKMTKIAPTLLLGCSSASLHDNKLLEPSGTVYSYLIGGCPMVVGMLWDVTDKDIDKFSESMLIKWGLLKDTNGKFVERPVDICEAIKQSRDICNLKYLNGAAPVVYGIPLSLI